MPNPDLETLYYAQEDNISYFISSHVTKPKPFVESSHQDLYDNTAVNIRLTSFTV
jgi:hypothetical protein